MQFHTPLPLHNQTASDVMLLTCTNAGAGYVHLTNKFGKQHAGCEPSSTPNHFPIKVMWFVGKQVSPLLQE